jgi:uncharacterized membrane protein YhhN
VTELAWVLLGGFLFVAGADWYSRVTEDKRLEYATKPLAMVLLIGVALALDPAAGEGGRRAWFVLALVLSLAGDVFLMLPDDRFVAGLGSFLLAHVAYVAGFLVDPPDGTAIAVAALVVIVVAPTLAAPVVWSLRRTQRQLTVPVVVYMVVISAMVVLALATGIVWAGVGAVLFFVSDYLIARDRFIRHLPWAPLAIRVLYHLGQAGLVLSLTSST